MSEIKGILIDAAWRLLEEKGLEGLTPEALSDASLLPEVKVRRLCPTSLSILLLLWSDVMGKTLPVNTLGLSAHEILFESIMNHFDTLGPYKKAVHHFIQDLSFSPCWLIDLKPYGSEWSRQRLNEAGILTEGLMGSIQIQVFNLFFLYILKIWVGDATPDQGLTLAVIDQGLKKLEKWQKIIREKLPF